MFGDRIKKIKRWEKYFSIWIIRIFGNITTGFIKMGKWKNRTR